MAYNGSHGLRFPISLTNVPMGGALYHAFSTEGGPLPPPPFPVGVRVTTDGGYRVITQGGFRQVSVAPADDGRITEDGQARITEQLEFRIIEQFVQTFLATELNGQILTEDGASYFITED